MSEGRSTPVKDNTGTASLLRPLLVAVGLMLLVLLGLHGLAALDSLRANLISIRSLRLSDQSVSLPDMQAGGRCRTLHARGRLYLLREQYEAAIPELEQAAECSNYTWAWFDLGRAQYALGRYDETAESWRQAGAFGYAEVLAQRVAQAGDHTTSFTAWKLAAAIDPAMPRPYLEMAQLLRTMGCPRQAVTLYEHLVSLELHPETTAQAEAARDGLVGVESAPTGRCPSWR